MRDAHTARPGEAGIIGAAVELFGERGVDGTSLQMIADALGVTKGAVYYHFKTKDEIIAAVFADLLREVEVIVSEAETRAAEASREAALELLVPRLVAVAVERRDMFNRLHGDPGVARFTAASPQYRSLDERIARLFTGDAPDAESLVRGAMASSALASVSVHPNVRQLDDDTLTTHLTEIIHALAVPRRAD